MVEWVSPAAPDKIERFSEWINHSSCISSMQKIKTNLHFTLRVGRPRLPLKQDMLSHTTVAHTQYKAVIGRIQIEIPSYGCSFLRDIQIGDKRYHLLTVRHDQGR